MLNQKIEIANAGTMIRKGHFCPYLSMNAPRKPAVPAPAIEFAPIAKPANAMDPVSR
ncbi:unannotated protein [freshwater metagenome]|uniref:Unannotated protein n=1 Tax=freshwater metagenome TaxID=449393 RepID=A0A6J7UGW6_9ZZZZ